MLNLTLLIQFLVICCVINHATTSNIGIFVLQGSASHKEVPYGIAEALIESGKGHTITYYTIFEKPKRNIKGVKEVYFKHVDEMQHESEVEFFDGKGRADMRPILLAFSVRENQVCDLLLQTPEFREFAQLSEPIFDVAIVDIMCQDCALPVLHRAAKSIVQVSTLELWIDWRWGHNIPYPVAYLPGPLDLDPTFEMGFFKRLNAAWGALFQVYFFEHLVKNSFDAIVKKRLPYGLPTIDEARRKVALILHSGSPAVTPSSPTTPMVKQIGGIHLKEKLEPLPKDLETFIEGSGEAGFIYVNFGTIVPHEKIPKHAKKAFVDAFSKVPQRVVWKFKNTDNMVIPANVKLVDWVPQATLLAHPKIRLFFNHGGLNGYIETVNYAVPCVLLPVFADQPLNALKMVTDGMAVVLDWPTLTPENVLHAIDDVVNQPAYKENALRMQNILRDRLVPPKQEAAFWIEYVIRHNGSTHLRIRADHLNVFQYFLLDVFAFVGTIVIGAIYLCYVILKLLFCRNSKRSQLDKLSKKNK